jgi:hypothetical protein
MVVFEGLEVVLNCSLGGIVRMDDKNNALPTGSSMNCRILPPGVCGHRGGFLVIRMVKGHGGGFLVIRLVKGHGGGFTLLLLLLL